jgi:hypothetical protein
VRTPPRLRLPAQPRAVLAVAGALFAFLAAFVAGGVVAGGGAEPQSRVARAQAMRLSPVAELPALKEDPVKVARERRAARAKRAARRARALRERRLAAAGWRSPQVSATPAPEPLVPDAEPEPPYVPTPVPQAPAPAPRPDPAPPPTEFDDSG